MKLYIFDLLIIQKLNNYHYEYLVNFLHELNCLFRRKENVLIDRKQKNEKTDNNRKRNNDVVFGFMNTSRNTGRKKVCNQNQFSVIQGQFI